MLTVIPRMPPARAPEPRAEPPTPWHGEGRAQMCTRMAQVQNALMLAHPANWLQRRLDGAAHIGEVEAVLAAYQRFARAYLGGEAPRTVAFRGLPVGHPDLERLAKQNLFSASVHVAYMCSDAHLDAAHAVIMHSADRALALLTARDGAKQHAALAVHLWSYLCATELDLSGRGMTCDDLERLSPLLADCSELVGLRLANNRLDARLHELLPPLVERCPRLAWVPVENNPLGQRGTEQLAASSPLISERVSREVRNEMIMNHAAVAEVESGALVQARLRGGRCSAAVLRALPSCVPLFPRVMELRLCDIAWQWPDLLETSRTLGRWARNLRHLALDTTAEPLLAGPPSPGEGEVASGPYDDHARLSAPLRQRLAERTEALLSPLGSCRALSRLALPNLLMGAGGMGSLHALLVALPDLLEVDFRARSSVEEEDRQLCEVHARIQRVINLRDPVIGEGPLGLMSRRDVAERRLVQVRTTACEVAGRLSLCIKTPHGVGVRPAEAFDPTCPPS